MTAFICLLFLWIQSFIGNSQKCPNGQFKIAARYHQQFDLKGIHATGKNDPNTKQRYYIAFGSSGNWVITLVDAIDHAKKQYIKFKCKENYWGSVEPIVSQKTKEDALQKYHAPICCVAPYTIDAPLPSSQKSKSLKREKFNPFAVLPFSHHKIIAKVDSPTEKGEYGMPWIKSFDKRFYWYLYEAKPTGLVSKRTIKRKKEEQNGFYQFKRWQIMRLSKPEWTASKDMILYKTIATWDDASVEKVDNCVNLEECDTGIVSDIVVFQSKCSASEHLETITFAFSSSGIFNLKSLLNCIPESVSFYPMTRLFREDNQYKPSYNIRKLGSSSIDLGWKLGSFCGSCPMTRMRMQISEKEALSNKQRLENALSISGKFDSGFGAGYTRKWVNEAAETLTSGRATTIEARCNGFYLWYWTINVGTWGTGTSVIPTQLFYCTDRQTPPVCKPRISKDDEFRLKIDERLCNGHDVPSDFDLNVDEVKVVGPGAAAWQSFHSGRPKPLRLQGQKVALNEPAFVTKTEVVEVVSSDVDKTEERKEHVFEKNSPGLKRSVSLNDDYRKEAFKENNHRIKRSVSNPAFARSSAYGDLYGAADKGLFVGNVDYDDDTEEEDAHSMLFYEFLMIGIAVIGTIVIVCFICGILCGYSSHKMKSKYKTKQMEFVLNAL